KHSPVLFRQRGDARQPRASGSASVAHSAQTSVWSVISGAGIRRSAEEGGVALVRVVVAAGDVLAGRKCRVARDPDAGPVEVGSANLEAIPLRPITLERGWGRGRLDPAIVVTGGDRGLNLGLFTDHTYAAGVRRSHRRLDIRTVAVDGDARARVEGR